MAERDLSELVDAPGIFMGADAPYEEAKAVILGIPMDFTVSFRPGARLGPLSIRNVSAGIEEYSVYQDKDLADCVYRDLGDLSLPCGNVQRSLQIIEKACHILLADGKFPIFLGGEHLVSYPLLRSFRQQYPDLRVLHFDAHADLREDYLGERDSHATVMRQVAGLFAEKRLYQFGIRSGTKEEFAFAREHTYMHIDEVLGPLKETLAELTGYPLYVTLDIDVVDPAYAPGTGTQEPGGCTSREILTALRSLAGQKVVGFDLVEVLPALDASERTALLAAKIVREVILAFT
ncbi:agmatinase [Acididesulfobacillus acetoxydans]|uniref:Agmatinase n=2 Tax=Acididesulfobacillus acetoxydans TaxID=1561005 RepID=A0A8S0X3B3_9FIRM|nr:agmatinase [Acididesulfobacillus acetoxydans]CAA7599940.1 agmatinase [Acididesulfobacillus acetoxydans]CEJ07968.1 Agmatinase [Acididesulfobacillus acetoxydans]